MADKNKTKNKIVYIMYKYCIVPKCKTTSIKCPGKHYFCVPRVKPMRDQWCKAMSRIDREPISEKTSLYVCEDHFNIETDVENLVQYRLMGGKMRLKSHVVPHRFDCQKLPPQLESAASTSNHNRVQNSSTSSILNEKKTIECLEAVVTYTSQMQHIVSNRGDLNSALQANSHLVGLLEKVVCEWFSRAQRSKEIGQITDQLFLQKAHESKQIFCIQSFEADHTWLQKFKTKYNITELDMKMLRIESNASPPSLDINDIVLDILKANPLTEFFPSSTMAVPIETDENVVVKLEEIDHQNDEAEMPTTIVNDEHARRHLKPLEEYVLLKDNFRAIGLISQLMEIFSTETKEEDIKTELE